MTARPHAFSDEISGGPAATPEYVCRPRAWCDDCRRPYGNAHGFPDLIIPNWAWVAIMGHRGGLLCPACICQRLDECGMERAKVPSWWASGPLSLDSTHPTRAEVDQPPPAGWEHYADWRTFEAAYEAEQAERDPFRVALSAIADTESWADWHPFEVACSRCASSVDFDDLEKETLATADRIAHFRDCPVNIAQAALDNCQSDHAP